MSKKASKINFSAIGEIASVAAGGFAANQVSNIVEKSSFASGKEFLVPILPFALGFGISIFMPKFKNFAIGMASTALIEISEGLISSIGVADSGTPSQTTVKGTALEEFKTDPLEKLS